MKTKVVLLVKKALANKKKIGDSNYRTLIIDNSKGSEEAIRLMEELGLAYRIEYLGNEIDPGEIKLPVVSLAYGKMFQGLAAIRHYGKTAFGPWPGEFRQ